MKAEIYTLDWLVFQLVWIILKKVNDLDIGELKTVPIDWNKLSDVVKNDVEVVKNTKFNTLKTKVNKLDKKFLMQLL